MENSNNYRKKNGQNSPGAVTGEKLEVKAKKPQEWLKYIFMS